MDRVRVRDGQSERKRDGQCEREQATVHGERGKCVGFTSPDQMPLVKSPPAVCLPSSNKF